jgi:hypothetical protein
VTSLARKDTVNANLASLHQERREPNEVFPSGSEFLIGRTRTKLRRLLSPRGDAIYARSLVGDDDAPVNYSLLRYFRLTFKEQLSSVAKRVSWNLNGGSLSRRRER